MALCKICKAKLSYKSSTSNLKKHLERKHPAVQFHPSKAGGHNTSRPTHEPLLESRSSEQQQGNEPIPGSSSSNREQQQHDEPLPGSSTSEQRQGNESLPAGPSGIRQHQHNEPLDRYISAASLPISSAQQTISRYYARKRLLPNEKKNIDHLLMGLFIYDFQPFSIVEDRGFRAFLKGLNSLYTLPD